PKDTLKGQKDIRGAATAQACNTQICLPPSRLAVSLSGTGEQLWFRTVTSSNVASAQRSPLRCVSPRGFRRFPMQSPTTICGAEYHYSDAQIVDIVAVTALRARPPARARSRKRRKRVISSRRLSKEVIDGARRHAKGDERGFAKAHPRGRGRDH